MTYDKETKADIIVSYAAEFFLHNAAIDPKALFRHMNTMRLILESYFEDYPDPSDAIVKYVNEHGTNSLEALTKEVFNLELDNDE